ncbi:NAD(P)/FAD-dependent oxidoreductase [Streptomyces lydicus]|uniref:FAD-dependent oxidoreductase n=1 Tax=Streptomyces lydicus TaxID=47763 RepID=UPI003409DDC6
MTNLNAYDVLVCGAGVGGIASARALSELGLRVLLIDRQLAPPRIAKGEVLQPGALRILRKWGTDRLLRERGAVTLNRLVIREPDGSAALTLDYRQLPPDDQQLLVHDHHVILAALTDSLGPNVEVRRGTLVREALTDTTGRVTGLRLEQHGVNTHVYAPLVVAADGLASRLRRTTGIWGTRKNYPHRLLSLDLTDPAWRPEDFSAFLTRRGLRLAYPLPEGRLRLYLQTRPDELRGLQHDQLHDWTSRALAEIPALDSLKPSLPAALDHRQIFSVARFLTERLVTPGMALIGEAAYAVHPMAAQGMNTAITSAAALADQLARQLRKPASRANTPTRTAAAPRLNATAVDAALNAYQTEQLPHLARTQQLSANAARMVTSVSLPTRLVGHRMMRRTGTNPRLLHTITNNLAGTAPHLPLTTLDRLRQIGLLPKHTAM